MVFVGQVSGKLDIHNKQILVMFVNFCKYIDEQIVHFRSGRLDARCCIDECRPILLSQNRMNSLQPGDPFPNVDS
jgi:hypothetical protein